MANKNDEMILVIPSKPFADTKKADITEADKALAISEHYEASMSIPGVAQLRRRGDMEENEKFVQPIPYTVLYHIDGNVLTEAMSEIDNKPDYYESVYVLSYKRGTEGGETRLHNMYSVGFGGHINSTDVTTAYNESLSSYGLTVELACAARELKEELGVDINTDKDISLDLAPGRGLCLPYVFYDDSSKVSSRHICKALYFHVKDMDHIKAEEDCIKKLTWVPLKELYNNMSNMESWSKIVVAYTKAIFDDMQRKDEREKCYNKLYEAVKYIFKENEELYHKVVDDKDDDALKDLSELAMRNARIQPKVHPYYEDLIIEISDRYRRVVDAQRLPGIMGYQIPAIDEKSKLQIKPE